MRILIATMIALTIGSFAQAETIFCVAGQLNADGTFKSVSQNPAQVAVLKDGQISFHTLLDPFSLFKTKYNISKPFPMKLVKQMGVAGTYTTTREGFVAKYNVIENGANRSVADFSMDLAALTGKVAVDSFVGDQWNGSTEDNLKCSLAGIGLSFE